MKSLLFFLLISLTSSAATAAPLSVFVTSSSFENAFKPDYPTPKITVWVEAATDEDGWEIKDFEDSARDLNKKIKGKFWQKAKSRESADVILTVVNRYQEGTGTVSSRYSSITGWSAAEEQGLEVEVLMILRNGKQRMFRSNGIALIWQKAANDTKKHIEKYLKENYDRVISLRSPLE